MHMLKEDGLRSHELLEQWANKDNQKAKPKKSKKSLEWNNLSGSAHGIRSKATTAAAAAALEKSLRGQLPGADKKKPPIKVAEQGNLTRENTIAKKTPPLAVEAPPPPPITRPKPELPPKQKDSINSTSSSSNGSVTNQTMTTTSSEASSSRSNSAGNGRGGVIGKNSVRPADGKTSDGSGGNSKKSSLNQQQQQQPPPPPATTINPPAKTDYNPVVKKNSVS